MNSWENNDVKEIIESEEVIKFAVQFLLEAFCCMTSPPLSMCLQAVDTIKLHLPSAVHIIYRDDTVQRCNSPMPNTYNCKNNMCHVFFELVLRIYQTQH